MLIELVPVVAFVVATVLIEAVCVVTVAIEAVPVEFVLIQNVFLRMSVGGRMGFALSAWMACLTMFGARQCGSYM